MIQFLLAPMVQRPRPFGVEFRTDWTSWALPSEQIVPGAGHGLPVDKPELFNRLVVDFLTGDTDGGDR
jgi:pimeloyl-ACP methyl ester carboxylesterase